MTTPASVGERVRTLRLANNISQTDLAASVTRGASEGNALISKIESGRQPADTALLEALSEALGCTLDFLTRPAADLTCTRPWLRAYADASSRVVEGVTADNLLVAETIAHLRLRRLPDVMPAFDGDLNDEFAIEEFAEQVRAAAEIAEGAVVGNAMRAADRLGCVVLPLGSELGRHLGMSQRIDGLPFIRVSRPGHSQNTVPGDRQRFTVLHEVGHLTLHGEMPPPETASDAQRIERQAHRFASAFLAPADALLDDWGSKGGRVTLSALAELKATWGIAIKALVVRFQQLGVVSADQATSLYKQISKRGWNKNEPVHTTNEEPIWLLRAITRFADRDAEPWHMATARAAGLSQERVRSWVDWSPIDEGAHVMTLPRRQRPSAASTDSQATVLQLPHR